MNLIVSQILILFILIIAGLTFAARVDADENENENKKKPHNFFKIDICNDDNHNQIKKIISCLDGEAELYSNGHCIYKDGLNITMVTQTSCLATAAMIIGGHEYKYIITVDDWTYTLYESVNPSMAFNIEPT